jgi:hypothetical protein
VGACSVRGGGGPLAARQSSDTGSAWRGLRARSAGLDGHVPGRRERMLQRRDDDELLVEQQHAL